MQNRFSTYLLIMNRKTELLKNSSREPSSANDGAVPQQTHPKIVAAIPCYNTALYIADVVTKAKKYVDQVIVIDDGSSDATAELARTAGATVVKHKQNIGYGGAIKSCFIAAKRNNADILVIIDGDAQHDPTELPSVVKPALDGDADIVIGTRFSNVHNNIPRYRRFGIKVINFIYNLGASVKTSDAQSGFRAYTRKALDTIELTSNGMDVSVETLVIARRKGLRMKDVPITCKYHSASSTLPPMIHGVSVAWGVMKFRMSSCPNQKV
jgi:glycosyltransferase involved in cell wall biosynthesis